MSKKHLTDTQNKYDKLIYNCETDINIKIQNLRATKKDETERMISEMNQIINDSLNQVSEARIRLEKIPQTSTSSSHLIDDKHQIKSIQKNYTQQYSFSHFESIELNDSQHQFPIYFQFGNNMNLHIQKDRNNKQKTKEILKDILFRNLIGLKFSKLKITMYDPIELGAFFADFHNLNKEITEGFVYNTAAELNEILESTIRHIAMVVQKILTNRFTTLDDYNEQNPELAEPFRFLIINDFSTSFENHQIEKLNQILTSGPKCGVYTIILGDINEYSLNLINSINVSAIEPIFIHTNVNDLINTINIGTKAAGTISIDLNSILTDESQWWSADSSTLIDLPLGLKGKEIQSLRFDNKDDNQALMIGKPGSGKSNLLHIIILSAITRYGPNDLEIYLIDFKGGVEFMPYAEYNIPQIRTVALESDREFGLSVIDGVEKELLRRETLFRNSGVQNIEQYNQNYPEKKIARILFIVDEFQEFFKIPDELKEQVSLKYDTVIRKGRAFGINSLFSSQTLDGHSMPRSTMELIDIRIALMCGANDVSNIMDGKNLSAKDLTRPGEAIYNAENGKSNGNQRFQAVFVDRKEISTIAKKVSEKSINEYKQSERFIFRGDTLSNIRKENHVINNPEMLKYKALRLWIGEPVKMEPDFHIDIKQSTAQNLILIGSNNDGASVFSSILYSKNFQQNKVEKTFIINPLSDVDEGFEGFQKSYGKNIDDKIFKPNQIDELFDELLEILAQRKSSNEAHKTIVCFINSLNKIQRLRDDNILYDKLFTLLNEGAEYGIHFILHCDSVNNLNRTPVSRDLSFFNHRIIFEMNQDAYYKIIGSYQIKQLKPNRMVYYSDELGVHQIIKPYELTNN